LLARDQPGAMEMVAHSFKRETLAGLATVVTEATTADAAKINAKRYRITEDRRETLRATGAQGWHPRQGPPSVRDLQNIVRSSATRRRSVVDSVPTPRPSGPSRRITTQDHEGDQPPDRPFDVGVAAGVLQKGHAPCVLVGRV
jgi:hypothetical protein